MTSENKNFCLSGTDMEQSVKNMRNLKAENSETMQQNCEYNP